jgi:threonine dehydratase
VARETPLQAAKSLSILTQNKVMLKREDLQPVFSFKIRGAYNKIANLGKDEAKKGIVTCSAGNHAQGVALSATRLGIDNVIVMPEITPKIKIEAVQRLGGNVKLVGKNFDEAAHFAKELAEREKRVLIHPYDDPLVIAGQGTIGMEILKQCSCKFVSYFVRCF